MDVVNFITIRLGKDSVNDIKKLCASKYGILHNGIKIDVECTQIPDKFSINDYAFIWLGSDNNKGIPTNWKQGFKAFGIVTHIQRAGKYNDKSITTINVCYIFKESINRLDILRNAPIAYYWCSSMPLIGIDDHANQTIRLMNTGSLADIRAFFHVVENVTGYFKRDIIKLNPDFEYLFNISIPNPAKYPNIKYLDEIEYNRLTAQKDINFHSILTALRAKPFLLLAGISGTGKSRIVKEMAYASCPDEDDLRKDDVAPGNYLLVEVKPNWHDSTELLGYESTIKENYVLTPFVKFLYKAMKYPNVPFFVCLDEMNLAPVEQYFAEFLSILESRKLLEDGETILSEPLIKAEIFNKYPDLIYELKGINKPKKKSMASNGYGMQETYEEQEEYQISDDTFDILKVDGLRIPQNVLVIGTVNMDETTHQFSRKVIDRAMTIEMNEVKFDAFFDSNDELGYTDEPLGKEYFLPKYTSAKNALESIPEDAEWIKEEVPNLLELLNKALDDTPFKVAYRVQNELVLYFVSLREEAENKDLTTEELLNKAMDGILMMKVLPRIEGDRDLLEKPLKRLTDYVKNYTSANAKIEEMQKRLDNSHFTSFWP